MTRDVCAAVDLTVSSGPLPRGDRVRLDGGHVFAHESHLILDRARLTLAAVTASRSGVEELA